MNSKLGVKLGEGGCAEVYAWEGESKIIKLAKPNTIIEHYRQNYISSRSVRSNT